MARESTLSLLRKLAIPVRSLLCLVFYEMSRLKSTDDFAAGADSSTGRVGGQASAAASSAFDTVVGAAKQAYGSATGDKTLEAEGQKQHEGSA